MGQAPAEDIDLVADGTFCSENFLNHRRVNPHLGYGSLVGQTSGQVHDLAAEVFSGVYMELRRVLSRDTILRWVRPWVKLMI